MIIHSNSRDFLSRSPQSCSSQHHSWKFNFKRKTLFSVPLPFRNGIPTWVWTQVCSSLEMLGLGPFLTAKSKMSKYVFPPSCTHTTLIPLNFTHLLLKRKTEFPLFAVIMAIIFAFWLNEYHGWSSSYTKLDLFYPELQLGGSSVMRHEARWTQIWIPGQIWLKFAESHKQTWTNFCFQVGVRQDSGFACFSENPQTKHSSAVWEKFGFIFMNLIGNKSMQTKTAQNSFKNPRS